MKIRIPQITYANSWKLLTAITLLAIIIIVLLSAYANQPQSSAVKAAQSTNRLLIATRKLSESLSVTTPVAQTADTYVQSINSIQAECEELNNVSKNHSNNATDSAIAITSNVQKLCEDITKLVRDSKQIYVPVLPLLHENTVLKRYMLIPFIANDIKNTSLENATSAEAKLSSITSSADSFPSHAEQIVRDLRMTIQTSSNLNYFPALLSTQRQLLAERQQYWTAFATIALLEKALKQHIGQYCELPDVRTDSTICTT